MIHFIYKWRQSGVSLPQQRQVDLVDGPLRRTSAGGDGLGSCRGGRGFARLNLGLKRLTRCLCSSCSVSISCFERCGFGGTLLLERRGLFTAAELLAQLRDL